MGHRYKPTTIPLSGYHYQNLIGLGLLLEWLEDPNIYKWVEFEADLDVDAKGLDDIIAEREDGRYLCWQVKFCVEPDRSDLALSWDWLTSHTKKGTSLIQKWFKSIENIGLDNLGETALVTNRKPDREFLGCLNAGYIDVDSVASEKVEILEEQLGSLNNVRVLFDALKITHSYSGYETLESSLKDAYINNHTDYFGWYRILVETHNWARYKNIPQPDGRITLSVLRQILSEKRPTPLPEDFRIPQGYMPPDDIFHESILDAIKNVEENIVVLTGSPGRGKSTYLSYLCDCLYEKEIPHIRHHYFLSLDDQSLDRVSLHSVGNTLISQIEKHYGHELPFLGTTTENLDKWIEECGKKYKEKSIPFVVIIDGLDHVWRENYGNKAGMDSLFRKLLPVPNNVIVIIGTQPVSEEQLPSILSRYISREDWKQLPSMSISAIRNWLEEQASAGRLNMPAHERQQDSYLDSITDAFRNKTLGHPLHLMYSLEALINKGVFITESAIETLPDCPEGDIRIYYRSLWSNLSFTAKDMLHLVASTGFYWPKDGIIECIGDSEEAAKALYEVLHLLYSTEAGLKPFHGSILAYIRDTEEHEERELELLPKVIAWLGNKSPDYYKWGWLWLNESKVGENENLIKCTTRTWVVESLCNAYPIEQIILILKKAEEVAFENSDYSKAIELRWIKTSLQNGPEYQIDNKDRLYGCAVRLTKDPYPLKLMSANLEEISDEELSILGQISFYFDNKEKTDKCINELVRRINHEIQYRRTSRGEINTIIEELFNLLALTGTYTPKILLTNISNLGDPPEELFNYFLSRLSLNNDIEPMLALWDLDISPYMRQRLEAECIRVSCIENAKISEWTQFASFSNHPISGCYSHLYSPSKYQTSPIDLSVSEFDKDHPEYGDNGMENFLHRFFYQSLSISLGEENSFSFTRTDIFKNRKFYNHCLEHFQKTASNIANVIRSGSYPSFDFLYRRLRNEIKEPVGHEEHRDYNAFRRALIEISQDLAIITYPMRGGSVITKTEFDYVNKSKLFIDEVWQQRYMKNGRPFLSQEAVVGYLKIKEKYLAKFVTPFNERASNYIELCAITLMHELKDMAIDFLKKAYYCVLGYGWRKDMTIFYVLNAIEYCAEAGIANVNERLKIIIPIVEHIGNFTDGDETRHARTELAELILKIEPELLPNYLDHLSRQQEWYYADKVLSVYLENVSLENEVDKSICSTLFENESTNALSRMSNLGNALAEDALQSQSLFLGVNKDSFGKERYTSSSSPESKCDAKPQEYPPENLPQYLEDIKECSPYEDRALSEWFEYWIDNNKESNAFREIAKVLANEKMAYKYYRVLDSVFDTSIKLEGSKKAYKWLVKAHIHGNGWGPWDSSEVSIKRLKKAAKYYKKKWSEFIKDTSISRYIYSNTIDSLVIPNDRLVKFLVLVGENNMAEQVADTMIRITQDEMADQPISIPKWIDHHSDGIINAIKVLFTRMRTPVNSIKWWTANRIAELLIDSDQRKDIWKYFLNRLKECRYETEVSELLAILFLSRESDVIDYIEVSRNIMLPSILSDFMLYKCSGTLPSLPAWSVSHVVEAPKYYSTSEQFEKVQGHQIPPILRTIMSNMQEETGYNMLGQWCFDWESIGNRSEAVYSDLNYFTKHDNSLKETGQFVTEDSHRGRSSFLRTLAFAVKHWDMPESEAISVAKLCLPINFTIVAMCPQQRPDYILVDTDQLSDITNLDNVVRKLIDSIIQEDSSAKPLYFDGLVKDENNEKIDLDILAIFHPKEYEVRAEQAFDLLGSMSFKDPRHNKDNSLILPTPEKARIINEEGSDNYYIPATNPYLPLNLGYWHSDLWSRSLPMLNNVSDAYNITAYVQKKELTFCDNNNNLISKVLYCNNNWAPMYPRELKSPCQIVMVASEKYIKCQKEVYDSEFTYIWRAKLMIREKEYGEFMTKYIYGTVQT